MTRSSIVSATPRPPRQKTPMSFRWLAFAIVPKQGGARESLDFLVSRLHVAVDRHDWFDIHLVTVVAFGRKSLREILSDLHELLLSCNAWGTLINQAYFEVREA